MEWERGRDGEGEAGVARVGSRTEQSFVARELAQRFVSFGCCLSYDLRRVDSTRGTTFDRVVDVLVANTRFPLSSLINKSFDREQPPGTSPTPHPPPPLSTRRATFTFVASHPDKSRANIHPAHFAKNFQG